MTAPWERLQDRLVRVLGGSPERRDQLVDGLLHRSASEATSYWLQLGVAIGIATLGLIVGSTAVIIGAMLVAPLMGPIVGLAMGLAAGSPLLVLRSAGRIAASVAVAVGGAAAITWVVPFHELNPEIVARISPTVLDLATAAFCALAGVYASLRPGSETAATAAGTSIGISLVPPLCASGFGLGTRSGAVAGGAMLLFVTNLVAIVVVGTASFFVAGFGRVDVTALEATALGETRSPVAAALARRTSRVFASRLGPVLRFLMPVALLLAVYVPLRRGLDEMAWQIRTRAAIREAMAREPQPVLETRVRVERARVEVEIVLLGSTTDAEAARARLDLAIRQSSGVVPRVEVLAVPDATAFAGLESSLRLPRPAPPVVAPPAEPIETAKVRLRTTLLALWPVAVAGAPQAILVEAAATPTLRIQVVHLGEPLGSDGILVIEKALSLQLGRAVSVDDAALPSSPITRRNGDLSFVALVSRGLELARAADLAVCVVRAPSVSQSDQDLADTVSPLLAAHPRLRAVPGEAWSVQFMAGACPAPPPSPAGSDAGHDADAADL